MLKVYILVFFSFFYNYLLAQSKIYKIAIIESSDKTANDILADRPQRIEDILIINYIYILIKKSNIWIYIIEFWF